MIPDMTAIILRMKLKERTNLVILRTLKALRILIALKADKFAAEDPNDISTTLMPTTNVSKRFIISPKKDTPYAKTLSTKSTAKINVKAVLMFENGGLSVLTKPFKARMTVFAITISIIKLSYKGLVTNNNVFLRMTLRTPKNPLIKISYY